MQKLRNANCAPFSARSEREKEGKRKKEKRKKKKEKRKKGVSGMRKRSFSLTYFCFTV
jgi:hypothetical protein